MRQNSRRRQQSTSTPTPSAPAHSRTSSVHCISAWPGLPTKPSPSPVHCARPRKAGGGQEARARREGEARAEKNAATRGETPRGNTRLVLEPRAPRLGRAREAPLVLVARVRRAVL